MMKRTLLALLLLCLGLTAQAIWVPPDRDVPLSRLLANVNQRLKKAPKVANLHYLKGRLHSLAFATSGDITSVYNHAVADNPVSFPPYATVKVKHEGALRKGEVDHLRTSLLEYRKSTELDPKAGLYMLGLAWMHEEGSPYAKQLKKLPWMKKTTTAKMQAEAVRLYWKIYRGWKERDRADSNAMAGEQDSYVSMEAAERLLVLAGPKLNNVQQKELQDFIAEIQAKPKAVTPIIFSLSGSSSLASLLAPASRVSFDIAGDNVARSWSWVTPSTGILCWDPHGTGRITSGRQLFGSATFWMMFSDGYAALASLDNDSDGWLRGSELAGISVWVDRDSDGVSSFLEVSPVGSLGVSGIRCRASGSDGGVLFASEGIEFSGGRSVATFDWVTEPVPGAFSGALTPQAPLPFPAFGPRGG